MWGRVECGVCGAVWGPGYGVGGVWGRMGSVGSKAVCGAGVQDAGSGDGVVVVVMVSTWVAQEPRGWHGLGAGLVCGMRGRQPVPVASRTFGRFA